MKVGKMYSAGFTLIELLVTIVIIGILATIIVSTISGYFAKARDAKRLADISKVHKAVKQYHALNGSYPSTGGLNNVYMDPNCEPEDPSDLATVDWVPDIYNHIDKLPQDPTGANAAKGGRILKGTCYMYSSDGNEFILTAWGTVETGPQTEKLYSRAGFREDSYNVQNAAYLCDHPNIGRESSGDYYQYSYTITNVDCSW